MPRIITISDNHFRHGPTLAETIATHAWFLADVTARARAGTWPDAIVICGDLADTALTADSLLAICDFVQAAAAICPVIILKGNHERDRELDVLAKLRAAHPITVFDKPGVHRIPGVAFALVPWIERVIPIKDLAGYTLDQEKAAEEKRLLEILDALEVELDAVAQPGDARVCCAHLMLDVAIGALANAGQPDPKGREFLVSLDQLDQLGCQVYALGHVHDGREWTVRGCAPCDADAPVFYNGSTRSWGWGEITGKRYVEIDVTGDAAVPAGITYVAIPGRAMIQIDDVWMAGAEPGDPWGWKHWSGVDGELDAGEAVNAVVRFAYDVPASRAEAARAAAADVEKALYGAGAHHVKLAPHVQPEQRPRRPAMAAAKTLEDKLDVYAESRGIDLASDVVTRARRHLGALRLEAGVAGRLAAGGMRLGSIEMRGMRAYRDAVKLDVESLPGKVIAMVGANGAGKSTLLAGWTGAMYRSTREGDIRRLALRDDDGVVKTTVMVGTEWWTLEHQIGRCKSFAYKADGAPAGKEGKLGEFQAWADAHLLPEDVARASIFAGQGSAGLLAVRPSERRDPLLKGLGLGPIKKLHGLALVKAKDAAKIANAARGALDAAKGVRVVDVPALFSPEVVDAARAEVLRLDAEVQRLDGEERRARAGAEALTIEITAARNTRVALDSERARCTAALRGLEEQLVEHRGILARADEIRGAVVECRALREEISTLTRDFGEHDDAADEAYAAWKVTDKAAMAACKKRQANADVAEYVARVEANAALLPARRAVVVAAEAALTGAIEALDAARVASAAKLSGRVDGLLGGLHEVLGYSDIEGAHEAARETIVADTDAVAAPGALAPLEVAVATGRAALAVAKVELDAIEPTASKLDAVISRRAAHLEAAIEEDAAITSGKLHEVRGAAAAALRAGVSAKIAAARAALVAPMVLDNQALALARAETSADTLATPIADRRSELAQIARRIADLPPAPSTTDGPDVVGLLNALYTAQAQALAARGTVLAAEEAARTAAVAEEASARARAVVVAAEAALVEPDAEDAAWELLCAFLGPKGLQTIEIDVACPELSAILHDLLACFGPRWSMSCEATRPTAKGDGEVDAISFPTIDSESDDTEPRDASCFSGGQSVPLSFAIRVALAVLVAFRTGTTLPTLVFDEPTAALHDINDFERLMAMIRRAAAMVGASKVLIVSHSPEFVALCDSAIVVANGKLDVISPARIPEA